MIVAKVSVTWPQERKVSGTLIPKKTSYLRMEKLKPMAPRGAHGLEKNEKLTKDYRGILGSHNLSNVGWHDGDGV